MSPWVQKKRSACKGGSMKKGRKARPNILAVQDFVFLSEAARIGTFEIEWKNPRVMLPPSYSHMYYKKRFNYLDREDRPIQCLILIDYGEGLWGDVGFYDCKKNNWCFQDGNRIESPLMGTVVAWTEYPIPPFHLQTLLSDSEEMLYRKRSGKKGKKPESVLDLDFTKHNTDEFLETVEKHIINSLKEEKDRDLCGKMDDLTVLAQVRDSLKSLLKSTLTKSQTLPKNGTKTSCTTKGRSSGRTLRS
jgi:hypothetical protein